MSERGNRKRVTGIVVSDRMEKTVVVEEEVQVRHPRYGKFIRRKLKRMAHDEGNAAKVGDFVEIEETRPLSRKKFWRVVKVIKSGDAVTTKRAGR